MNTITKMRRTQRMVKRYLEQRGFKVWFIHHTRFQKDIWGLFDAFCISREGTAMVQAKSGRFPPMLDFITFSKAFPSVSVMLVAVDRHRIRVREIRAGAVYNMVEPRVALWQTRLTSMMKK